MEKSEIGNTKFKTNPKDQWMKVPKSFWNIPALDF